MGILDTLKSNKEVEQKAAAMDAIVAQKNAEDLARQEFGRMKAAEAANVLNQGQYDGLAGRSMPYHSGISEEDAYRQQLANNAAQANAARQPQQIDPAIMEQINKNRAYNEAVNYANTQNGMGDGPADLNTIQRYEDNIDQGLADRWMQSYKGH